MFRGEPFEKMYDQWSEDMRHRILTQLETDILNFIKECLNHNDRKDARKVSDKYSKLVPYSEEIKNAVKRS